MNLEQRMANSYLDLFPRFIPDEEAPVSAAEQEQFYMLMKRLYDLAYDEPQLFVSELHEDDVYPNRFNKTTYGKPQLFTNQRKFLKAVDALLQNMFLMGREETVKLNKRQKEILGRLEIVDAELPAAWKWMSQRPGADPDDFAHCFFRQDYPYLSDIYAGLLGGEFTRLEKWMTGRGYRRYVSKEPVSTGCKVVLSYANPAWSGEEPSGSFLYKVKHTGICVKYEPYFQGPCVMGLCIPNGLKPFLDHFEDMDDILKAFVMRQSKRCEGCRYCVQTDKTGQRPLANIPVLSQGEEALMCPYFPGFSYCWTELNADLTDCIIRMLEFMDGFAES